MQYIGAIDDNYSDETAVKTKYVENAVDALLKNQEVPVKTTKAIGCSSKHSIFAKNTTMDISQEQWWQGAQEDENAVILDVRN